MSAEQKSKLENITSIVRPETTTNTGNVTKRKKTKKLKLKIVSSDSCLDSEDLSNKLGLDIKAKKLKKPNKLTSRFSFKYPLFPLVLSLKKGNNFAPTLVKPRLARIDKIAAYFKIKLMAPISPTDKKRGNSKPVVTKPSAIPI